jgi:UPF0271 protein
MSGLSIDINCDMGEGMDNEADIMPYISSANISCGLHAGNRESIKKTIELALEYNVAIGAHPSYDDRANFGRISQTISLLELAELIAEQYYEFEKIAIPLGASIHHVKLHGALYNDCAKDAAMSKIFTQTIQAIDPSIMIYGLSESQTILQSILAFQPYANEVFADRTYQKDGTLTPRNLSHALIQSEEAVIQQVLKFLLQKKVTTLQGVDIPIKVDTICIHGDGPHAISFAKCIFDELKNKNIEIKVPY